MIVTKTKSSVKGVPDYYEIYANWIAKFRRTGCHNAKALAYHYARVAEEMGQAIIDDEPTLDEFLD